MLNIICCTYAVYAVCLLIKRQNPEDLCPDSFTGSEMWLCYNNHGSVLVYRVHAPGCDGPSTCRPLPNDGHHEGWWGTDPISALLPSQWAQSARFCEKPHLLQPMCVRSCSRSALSIWKTLTCCSLVDSWWPSQWRTGTFINASLSESSWWLVSVHHCKRISEAILAC